MKQPIPFAYVVYSMTSDLLLPGLPRLFLSDPEHIPIEVKSVSQAKGW
jgi:hypothetical protein